jgi:hypothetical protein
MEKEKIRVIEKVAVHLILDGNGEIKALLHRDQVTKKHLFYFVKEGSCDEIATFIQTKAINSELSTDDNLANTKAR